MKQLVASITVLGQALGVDEEAMMSPGFKQE